MNAVELGVIVFLAFLAFAYWRKNNRGIQKQCPKCGAYCPLHDETCKYCGYEFETAETS